MTILTYKGNKFDYKNITKESINIDDIVHALPRINRFIGHSSRAYNVAEHSLHCYYMAKELGYSPRLQLLTLIHDFTESYMSDCPTPLKILLPEFSRIEAEVEKAIYEHIGISHITEEEHLLVKRIDLTMLAIEMRDLTLHTYENFINEYTYVEMMEDEEFDLSSDDNLIFNNEDFVRICIKYAFDNLLEEIKGEDNE